MEKKNYNIGTRVMAIIASLLIMVGAAGMLPQNSSAAASVSNIYNSASGMDVDAVFLTVDGQDVTAQEYLYYVMNYGYQYYSYYAMSGVAIDWDMPVSEDSDSISLTDLIKAQAQEAVVQDAIICKMAADNGITVTQEEKDSFRATVASMKEMYGETYENLLMSYGLTESLWELRNDISCLTSHLQEAYLNGALRPDDAALMELVNEHGLTMARSLVVSTAYLEADGIEEAKATAEEYRERITDAEDMAAELVAINTELGVADEENIASLYHCGHDHGDGDEDAVCETLTALEIGELSEVVEADDGFYLLLREELDMDTIAQMQFSEDVEAAIASAEVILNDQNLEKLNVGAFIENYMAILSAQTATE